MFLYNKKTKMGYGVEVHTGVIKKCGHVKWFETKGGYDFYKFSDWDLEQSTIIDIDRLDSNNEIDRRNHEEYIYWIDQYNNLVFRDDYGQSRKVISINKVIKDLKRLLKEDEDNQLQECLDRLEADKKKGLKLVLFVGT